MSQGGFDFTDVGIAPDPEPIRHDPLTPDWEQPTPIEMVMRLTRPQREKRVERLIEMSWTRYREGVAAHSDGKTIAHVAAMFSGGNDSATVAHLFRPVLTHMIHANTGTGIEATREHVRGVAAGWGLPLIEESPKEGEGYVDFVLNTPRTRSGEITWPGGFPGPAAHGFMQQRLKERATDQARHTLGIANSQTRRGVWIAGRRRAESEKRKTIPHHEADGSVIWVSPIAVWHKADLMAYRLMHDVPVNPVAERLGMSGECGCLANAKPGEADRWRAAYPDEPFVRDTIPWLEQQLANRIDIPAQRRRWGHGGVEQDEVLSDTGRMCDANCGPDPLLDLMDPLFDLSA